MFTSINKPVMKRDTLRLISFSACLVNSHNFSHIRIRWQPPLCAVKLVQNETLAASLGSASSTSQSGNEYGVSVVLQQHDSPISVSGRPPADPCTEPLCLFKERREADDEKRPC